MVRAKAAVTERMADHVGTLDEAIKRAAVLGKAQRRGATAARTSVLVPSAGINDAPNLREGMAERSCGNCEYFAQPSADVASGRCSLYDFTTDRAWVCDGWEAGEEETPAAPDEAPAVPEEPPSVALSLDQRLALARLRTL